MSEEIKEAVSAQVSESISHLIGAHWKKIDKIMSEAEDDKIAISCGIKMERMLDGSIDVDIQFSFSEKTKDSVELKIDNPDQLTLEIGG